MKNSTKSITKILYLRRLPLLLPLLLLIPLGIAVELDLPQLWNGLPAMGHLIGRMLTPDLPYAKEVLTALSETVEIAVIASLIGTILSVPFVLLSASTTRPFALLAEILNKIFAFLRTVPSLIWAALLVSVFGLGKFPGILALAIIALLISQKLLREGVEGIETERLQAVLATGANRLQLMKYCVFPELKELLFSSFFIVLESNIRSAAVLGFVGAGGIGLIMWRDMNHMQYDRLATIILILFFTVLLIDLISLFLRKYLLNLSFPAKNISALRRKRKLQLLLNFSFIAAVFFLCLRSAQVTQERLMIGLSQGAQILRLMIAVNPDYLPKLLVGLRESFFIAVFATLAGGLLALLFSYPCAYTISPSRRLSLLMKLLVNIMRTFPPIITAIILFRGVGPGPAAGALSLTIYTGAILTKMYCEHIEGLDRDVADSLRATGANNFQIYHAAVVPQTLFAFLGFMLYRLESNIRNSTILGVIGAGGIGTLITMNIKWRNWGNVGLLILGAALLTAGIDALSTALRKKLK
ncbi:MAG: ABC transporter permease subunit [Peptostreptococcaceae bacterium]|nr:ABC transporter permease subunit [Peptostreptococcaceae bacterium]